MNNQIIQELSERHGVGKAVIVGLNEEVRRQCYGDELTAYTDAEIAQLVGFYKSYRATAPAVRRWIVAVEG